MEINPNPLSSREIQEITKKLPYAFHNDYDLISALSSIKGMTNIVYRNQDGTSSVENQKQSLSTEKKLLKDLETRLDRFLEIADPKLVGFSISLHKWGAWKVHTAIPSQNYPAEIRAQEDSAKQLIHELHQLKHAISEERKFLNNKRPPKKDHIQNIIRWLIPVFEDGTGLRAEKPSESSKRDFHDFVAATLPYLWDVDEDISEHTIFNQIRLVMNRSDV